MSDRVRVYRPGDEAALREIVLLALAAGELTGTDWHDLEHLLQIIPAEPNGTLVSLEGDIPAGFFAVSYPMLIVHPRFRRRKHGTRLVQRALENAQERGVPDLELAPPRGSAVAETFAASLGFAYRSSLWQMRLDQSFSIPLPCFSRGFIVRAFEPGRDEVAYVDLINRSFADHPSPVSVTADLVRHVHDLPGFDSANIALVSPPDDRDQPIAFCRVKVDGHDGVQSGEVAFIGVLPAWRGIGLGRELLRWGVHRLIDAGVRDISLTVEARNELALGLYERTGFIRVQEWPRWAKRIDDDLSLAGGNR